jgi:hypothetical protein
MSNDAAADAYAHDCGQDELRADAIDELAGKYYQSAIDTGEMPDGGLVIDLLAIDGEFTDVLADVNWDVQPEFIPGEFLKMQRIAQSLIAAECERLAEIEVDNRGDDCDGE